MRLIATAFNELLSNVIGNRPGADSIVRRDIGPLQQTQYSTLIMEAIREPVPTDAASTTSQDSFLGEFFTAVINASNHTGSNRAFEDFLMNALGSMTKTRKRQKQTIKLLSEQNPTFEALIEVGFRRALECEHVDLVQFLVENSIVDPNKPIRIKFSGEFAISQAYFPVEYAISRRNFVLAEVLIKFGARPDEPASILDRLASTEPEALRHALSRGLVDFSSTIGALCRHGHRHVAQRALELDIDRITRRVDHTEAFEASESFEFTLSLLWGAISVGDIRIAELIIKLCRDLDLDLKEQPGKELVSLAVGAQSLEMLRLLLKNGAAVNTPEPRQISPLTLAILNSNVAVARLLIEWGAYVDRPSGPGLRAPSPLQVAAYTGSCEMASLLISRGVDVNAPPPTLSSCHSLRNNNSLKERWINNVLKEISGKTAILIAATCGGATSLQMVQLLGENGADVNSCLVQMIDASKSQTSMNPRISTDAIFQSLLSFHPSFPASKALYFAIEQGFMQSVKFIFEGKAGCSSRNSSSRLSIRSAIKSSWLCERPNLQFAVISYLIKQGASIGHTKHGPLKFSGYLFKTNPDLAKLLLQNGASVDYFKELEDALLRGGCEDMEGAIRQIQSIVPDHTKPRDPCLGHWSLTKLFRIGYDNMAKSLLEWGVCATAPCAISAVLAVCYRGDLKALQMLLSFHAPVDLDREAECSCWRRIMAYGYDGLTPLQIVARSGRLDMAQTLLQANVTVNAIGDVYAEGASTMTDRGLDELYHKELDGRWTRESTLSLAVEGGLQMVELIFRAGADVNEPAHERGGRTALQKAAQVGDLEIVDFLLQHHASVNAAPARCRGVTALQAAAINSHFDIACRLLERGANPNVPGAENDGRTALEGAAERGRIDMIQLLLDNGADIESADFGDGQLRKAVELAEGEGYHAAARLLKRYRGG